MQKLYFFSLILTVAILMGCKNEQKNTILTVVSESNEMQQGVKVIPINHGTLILETESDVIYVDPTGGKAAFINQKSPTLVLITDIHGDHLSTKTLEAIDLSSASVIAPKAVVEKIPSTIIDNPTVLNNGDVIKVNGISIEAIPMYNLREEALKFHEKGRGNGYVLTVNDERIYISGDTEDIPEMRKLQNIDKAFVCMNLPYTMPVESAASAVLDFKPKMVYPYHYRGTSGLSDVVKFKTLIEEKNDEIEVVLENWYKS